MAVQAVLQFRISAWFRVRYILILVAGSWGQRSKFSGFRQWQPLYEGTAFAGKQHHCLLVALGTSMLSPGQGPLAKAWPALWPRGSGYAIQRLILGKGALAWFCIQQLSSGQTLLFCPSCDGLSLWALFLNFKTWICSVRGCFVYFNDRRRRLKISTITGKRTYLKSPLASATGPGAALAGREPLNP